LSDRERRNGPYLCYFIEFDRLEVRGIGWQAILLIDNSYVEKTLSGLAVASWFIQSIIVAT